MTEGMRLVVELEVLRAVIVDPTPPVLHRDLVDLICRVEALLAGDPREPWPTGRLMALTDDARQLQARLIRLRLDS